MHERVHGIVDPESTYSTDRLVKLEILEIASEQKHPDGEFFSLCTEGYTYRRREVPDLLKIMSRSKFLDMSPKSQRCLTWKLGGEKERKNLN